MRRKRLTAAAKIVTLAQLQAAQEAVRSSERMLEEQGVQAPIVSPVAPAAFAGVASDGRDLVSLIAEVSRPDAPTGAFNRAVFTQIADAGRAAGSVSIAARPKIHHYVRMVSAGACSRCLILAGKEYRWNQGFSRHPHCLCTHIPVSENTMGHLLTDPDAHFAAMSEAEQDRVFTKAGAQAIRDGADMAQVVNARRGMTTAQIGGRDVRFTREGVTRRGLARSRMGTKPVRIMPETIYEVATDRADAIRLLRTNGYLTD